MLIITKKKVYPKRNWHILAKKDHTYWDVSNCNGQSNESCSIKHRYTMYTSDSYKVSFSKGQMDFEPFQQSDVVRIEQFQLTQLLWSCLVVDENLTWFPYNSKLWERKEKDISYSPLSMGYKLVDTTVTETSSIADCWSRRKPPSLR